MAVVRSVIASIPDPQRSYLVATVGGLNIMLLAVPGGLYTCCSAPVNYFSWQNSPGTGDKDLGAYIGGLCRLLQDGYRLSHCPKS